MKVFRKVLRKIIINEMLFYYIVDENDKDVKFRVYSGKYKTSFFEMSISYRDSWYINLYKRKIAAKIIEYTLESGWNHLSEKQIIKLSDGSFLTQKLQITE